MRSFDRGRRKDLTVGVWRSAFEAVLLGHFIAICRTPIWSPPSDTPKRQMPNVKRQLPSQWGIFLITETRWRQSLCKQRRPTNPARLKKLKTVLRFKGGKVTHTIIWFYSLLATIVFSLLGLALLVSSAFGHAFGQ